MSEHGKSLPGRPRSVQSHQSILQAPLDLLAEVGYERMSIDAIKNLRAFSSHQAHWRE